MSISIISLEPRTPMDLNPARFAAAVGYPLRAFFYILGHPSAWPWCVGPLLINTVIAAYVWIHSSVWMARFAHAFASNTSWWASALHWGATALSFVLRLLMVLLAIVIVGNFASVPFNDFLSERIDKMESGWHDASRFRPFATLWRVSIALIHEVLRLSIYLGLLAFLFVLSFFPPFAAVTLPAKLLLTCAYLSLDYLAYPLERRGAIRLGQKLAFVRANLASCLGFGAGMFVLALVPFVNFLFLPLGVVGGTLLFTDLEARRRRRLTA